MAPLCMYVCFRGGQRRWGIKGGILKSLKHVADKDRDIFVPGATFF